MNNIPDNKRLSWENALKFFLAVFFFLFPWPTVWLYMEQAFNGQKWEYGTLGFYLSEILIWLIFVCFFFLFMKKLARRGKKKFSFTADRLLALAAFLFVAYGAASVFWAIDLSLALRHALYVIEGFLLFFILLIGPMSWINQMKWFAIGSVVPSILGIGQFLSQSTFSFKWLGLVSHPVWELGSSVVGSAQVGRWLRAYGSFSHPNMFGGYLVVALLFTGILIYSVKIERHRAALLGVYLLQLTALFFTFSRAAWISFAILTICLVVVGIQRFSAQAKKRFTFYIAIVLIMISILFGLYHSLVRVRTLADSRAERLSISQRIDGYGRAFVIFGDNAMLGTGIGNYTLALYRYWPGEPGWAYQPVHNTVLLLIVELGLVGYALFVFLLLSMYLFNLSYSRQREQSIKILLFLTILLSPILIVSLLDHYLFSSFFGIILCAIYLSIIIRIIPQSLHN